MDKQYIGNFDLIKIIAATGIVFHHYQQLSSVKFGRGIEFYGGAFTFAYFVELFFIISGFLTEYTFKDKKGFCNWLIGRVSRYYPYSFIACFCSLIIAFLFFRITGKPQFELNYDIPTMLTSLTLFHSGWIKEYSPAVNNPTWYLCVLTLCFILYWLLKKLFKLVNIQPLYGFITIACLIAPLYQSATYHGFKAPLLFRSDIRGYVSFFFGCALCCFYRKHLKITMIVAAIVLSLFSVVGFFVFGLSNWYVLTFAFFPAIILFALFIPQVHSNFLKRLGAISFEVYLWHVPLFALMMTLHAYSGLIVIPTYFSMFIFCAIVWVCASIVYFFIEKPLTQKMQRRIVL